MNPHVYSLFALNWAWCFIHSWVDLPAVMPRGHPHPMLLFVRIIVRIREMKQGTSLLSPAVLSTPAANLVGFWATYFAFWHLTWSCVRWEIWIRTAVLNLSYTLAISENLKHPIVHTLDPLIVCLGLGIWQKEAHWRRWVWNACLFLVLGTAS